MRVAGIDEAGRGPVLGPLVIAAVLCDDQEALRRIGVRDSKRLSPQRRTGLALQIATMAECRLVVIQPAELDEAVEETSLNLLEARHMAELIRGLQPDRAFVDCCDTSVERFRRTLLHHIGYDVSLTVEHRADERYPVVSAASIVAKVRRDDEVHRLSESLGQSVGSGYAHDPVTRAFLEAWVKTRDTIPPGVRRSWKTYKRLMSRVKLRKLTEWD